MNLAEVQTILTVVFTAFDRDVPDGLDIIWAETLSDIPFGLGKAAALDCLKSSPYLPKIADIRERVQQLRSDHRRTQARRLGLEAARARPTEPAASTVGGQLAGYVLGRIASEARGLTGDARTAVVDQIMRDWREQRRHPAAPPRTGQHCGRVDCRCTHTEGCDAGWIELKEHADGSAQVVPCRVCHPDRAELFASGDRRDLVQRQLRDTTAPKRAAI